MPELSIIVPVYNVEKYLVRCVNSILSQSFSDFELILVDDGSTDQSGMICDDYSKIDIRVRVIHKKNGGLSDARNVGLDAMKGQYVCFIDSDDWIPKDALSGLLHSLKKNHAQFVVGNLVEIYDDGTIKSVYSPATKETVLEGDEILSTLNRPNAPNRIYISSIFNTLRFPVGKLYEDVFIYHYILERVNRIVLYGEVTYYYYVRKGSIMHTKYDIRFTDIIDAINDRIVWLDKNHKTELANQNRLFIYSQYAVAVAHIKKDSERNRKRLIEIRSIYLASYSFLMQDKTISIKQKIRLLLLKEFPEIHSVLFGKRMPINLG